MYRYEIIHEVFWNGTRGPGVGSVEANMDLFCKPEYAREDTTPRVVVRRPSPPRVDIQHYHEAVLAAIGPEWTQATTVARRITRSYDSVRGSMRRLVSAGRLEVKHTAPEYSRLKGATWYRRRVVVDA